MKTTFLILFYLSIAYSAYLRIKHDPAINAKVLWVNLLAIILCCTVIGLSTFVLIHLGGGKQMSEIQAVLVIVVFMAWVIFLITVTAILLKKYMKKENIKS